MPELYSQFGELVESNMQLGDILPLVPLAASLASDTSQIEGYSIDRTMVTPFRTSSGAAVLLPNRETIQTTFASIFTP